MAPLEDKSNFPIKSPRQQSNLGSASNSARTVTFKNSRSGDQSNTSGSSSVAKEIKRRGTRDQPSRQCKEKQTINAPIKSDIAPKTNEKPKKESQPQTSVKRVKKTKNKRISRSTRKRLLKNLKKAAKDAANAERGACLRVSRTVELVNQKDEGWREEKSKLLFMLSLGLTPILQRPAIGSTPVVKISAIPDEMLPKARTTFDAKTGSEKLKLHSLRKLWRERRAQILRDRARAKRFPPSFPPMEIEVIDLSEDGESQSGNPKKLDDTQSLTSSSSIFDEDVIILD